MRVTLIQNEPTFGDSAGNASRLASMMAANPATIYVLPELCASGYAFASRDEAMDLGEGASGPSVWAIRNAAASFGAACVFGFPERAGDRLFNSAMVALPDGKAQIYRKSHLYGFEADFFAPGDTGFFVVEWEGLRIGPAICFDWIFPESFRCLALLGADIVAHCANLVMPHCQRVDFARAIENRVYVATANRCGVEDRAGRRLAFTGRSVAVSPLGDYLVELPDAGEAAGSFELDPALARNKRLASGNDLFAERRPELYGRERKKGGDESPP